MTLGLRAQTFHFRVRVATKRIDFRVVLGKLALEFMQQVLAFLRLQTVPAVPAPAARLKLWILNSWRDLIYKKAEENLRVAKAADAQIFPAAHQ